MLFKTRGIVFKCTDYSESSVVVQVFTEKFGMQSYLINGVKRPSARIKKNILQPLHLLEMVVYHKETSGLQRVSELKQSPPFRSIPYDVVKSSIVFFLNEVLYRTIKQSYSDSSLFSFLFHAIEGLDTIEEGTANFHLTFLMRLTRFLGFFPHRSAAAPMEFFDLIEGVFSAQAPAHAQVLQPPHTRYWAQLMDLGLEELEHWKIPAGERKFLLDKMVDYYRLHVDGFPEIRSKQVLAEVLS